MGSTEEKTGPEPEEEIPFTSSQSSRKIHVFETSHVLADVSHTYSHKWLRKAACKSINVVVLNAKINLLLPFGLLAIFLHYLKGNHGLVFLSTLLGIAPSAERLGYVTEQLAFYAGSTVGGLLNATFGNATEMIISIYALKNGMIRVVQQSLLGSILSNMLLVLGCAFFTGGIVHYKEVQVFNKAAAVVNSGLLLMAVMGIMFPAVLHFTHTEAHFGKSELALSRFSSCIMLVAYASYLFFQLKSQQNLYGPIVEHLCEASMRNPCTIKAMQDWFIASHLLLQTMVGRQKGNQQMMWWAPKWPWVKLNTDGCSLGNSGYAAAAAGVFRVAFGRFHSGIS